MKEKLIRLVLVMASFICLTACSQKDSSEGESGETIIEESASNAEDTSSAEAIEEGSTLPEETKAEKPKKIDTTKFDNLHEAATQVGFSFRALENLSGDDYQFEKFSISEKVQEVNGMELTEPFPVVKLQYSGKYRADVTIFPYEGETLYSASQPPICYVSTKEINGIDVNLSETMLRMVEEDYEMTEEDWEITNSGKGGVSCDFFSLGDIYYRCMYWVQDGIFYEFALHIEDVPVEEIEATVSEYINGELQ